MREKRRCIEIQAAYQPQEQAQHIQAEIHWWEEQEKEVCAMQLTDCHLCEKDKNGQFLSPQLPATSGQLWIRARN